jgi:hypothetical protein
VWVVDGWMSMEQWWNDTDRGKLKYWEESSPSVTSTTFNLLQTTKTDLNYIYISSPYRAVNTLRPSYKNQSVNAV